MANDQKKLKRTQKNEIKNKMTKRERERKKSKTKEIQTVDDIPTHATSYPFYSMNIIKKTADFDAKY